MRNHRLAFALFAAAILFSVVREWNAPVVCARTVVSRVAEAELAGCRPYEPAKVRLQGTLVRETFPGPPNYTDTRKGDKAETYWLLNLDSPICMEQDKAEPDLNPALKNVRKVQLVVSPETYERQKALAGKSVVATGSLFGGHTGHHHTPVLLTVADLSLRK